MTDEEKEIIKNGKNDKVSEEIWDSVKEVNPSCDETYKYGNIAAHGKTERIRLEAFNFFKKNDGSMKWLLNFCKNEPIAKMAWARYKKKNGKAWKNIAKHCEVESIRKEALMLSNKSELEKIEWSIKGCERELKKYKEKQKEIILIIEGLK